jgi:hypothetical protein
MIPHPPQFLVSYWTFTQDPPQYAKPNSQLAPASLPAARQAPFWQLVPIWQTFPQLPQLLLSYWVLRQVPLHIA